MAEYDDNPGTGFSGDIGKYIDVHINDTTDVDEIEIRLYYTDDEIEGLNEASLGSTGGMAQIRWSAGIAA